MDNRAQRGESAKRWVGRFDHAARELNVFLLVLAIGLAALDITCLFAFEMRDALPSVSRVAADPSLSARPAVPATDTVATLAPTRPSVTATR